MDLQIDFHFPTKISENKDWQLQETLHKKWLPIQFSEYFLQIRVTWYTSFNKRNN